MSPTINETKVSDIEDNYAGFFKREKNTLIYLWI
jgi:hypothetical protein